MKNQSLLQSGSLSESRRQFLEKAGFAAVMSTFGISFFTSCVSTEEPGDVTTPANASSNDGITISGSTVQINLSVQTKLAASGGWLLVVSAKTLIANLDGAFVAMTSVCTHSGCFDSWSFTNNRFTCTCHNSIFNTAGQVLQGPATQPLQVYNTSVSGTTLTINK
uniref:QcrA and Rieske domain-containing protein n=1 Tax=Algoriphagus sp. TaxID=1872435 RepID=UPI00404786B0